MLLHSPVVADGWRAFLTAIRQKASLSDRHRELAILRVAVINRAPYEFAAHIPFAKKSGFTDAEIREIEHDKMPASVTDADRAVEEALRFARLVEPLDIRWLEEPCYWHNDREDLAALRRQTSIPICAGQSEITLAGCRELMNAGAIWEDTPVAVDRHFVSSRKPGDLPAFMAAIVEVLASAAVM